MCGWLCPRLSLGSPLESTLPPPTLSGQIVKKSCYPRWNETFEFELEEGAAEALCVEAWDWDLVSRNDFLGKVSTRPFGPSLPSLHASRPLPQRGAWEASHGCSGTLGREPPSRKQ